MTTSWGCGTHVVGEITNGGAQHGDCRYLRADESDPADVYLAGGCVTMSACLSWGVYALVVIGTVALTAVLR